MTQTRAERRREDRDAKNGAAAQPPGDGIDDWLLGDSPEASDPMPIHRFQVSVADYQRSNNTRYSARRQLQVGRDLGDDGMVSNARVEGRRARALMDAALEGITEAWPKLSDSVQSEWFATLPEDIQAVLRREPGDAAQAVDGAGPTE